MGRALLIIDVQESFRQAADLAQPSPTPSIADHLARWSTARGRPATIVIWVLHSEPGTGSTFDPASGHVADHGAARTPGSRCSPRPRTTPSPRRACSSCSPSRASPSVSSAASDRAVLRDHRPGCVRPRLPGHLRHRGHRDQPDRASRRATGRPDRRRAARGSRDAARRTRSSSGPSTHSPGGSRPSHDRGRARALSAGPG